MAPIVTVHMHEFMNLYIVSKESKDQLKIILYYCSTNFVLGQ